MNSIVVDPDNPVYDSRENCNAIIETSSNTLIMGCQKSFIPNSIDTIGKGAFFAFSGVESIDIPERVVNIGDYAFVGCSNLPHVKISRNVKKIGEGAFYECNGINSIILPQGLTYIGMAAFSECFSLKEVYCLAEDVPFCEYNVFEGTPIENATLYVPEASIEEYKASEIWSKFKEIKPL